MKIKLVLCIAIMCFLNIAGAQEKETINKTRDHHITLSTSLFQYFHPYTSVFPIGIEAKAFNDVAFYAEYGLPVKLFKRSFDNSGKENWHYYKTRLGVRYYFDPLNPYKRKRRRRRSQKRKLKTYRNYVSIEGFVVSEQFTRKDHYYRLATTGNSFSTPRINYAHSKVFIETKGIVFMYGRRYRLGEKMFVGVNYGFGKKIINVKHEDVISAVLPPGSFGFFGGGSGEENIEGFRSAGYIKIGIEIGFTVL